MNIPVGIAIVGCGYIADSYRLCLRGHASTLDLRGVFDRDPARLDAHVECWGGGRYETLDALLADESVRILVNSTDPLNHAPVTRAAIAAGKHVYSEKPLATTTAEAIQLRDLARAKGVRLASAPCNMLGESAQTAWRAVRAGRLGKVRLVYAEIDDGMVHRADYKSWINRSGRAWPARHEFETGCTFEHAGYALTVLGAMFGPVRRVTSFSTVLIPDKQTTPPLGHCAPDFSVGLLEYDDGVVARLTNSIVAPYDHRMRIVGDDASLTIDELWDYASPVRLRGVATGRVARVVERKFGALLGSRLVPARKPTLPRGRGLPTMDFARGVAELAQAAREGRRSRLDEDFAVHVTEVTEALQYPERRGPRVEIKSSFEPIAPMEWAT